MILKNNFDSYIQFIIHRAGLNTIIKMLQHDRQLRHPLSQTLKVVLSRCLGFVLFLGILVGVFLLLVTMEKLSRPLELPMYIHVYTQEGSYM